MAVGRLSRMSCLSLGLVKLPNYQLPNSQLNEVWSDAAERAAGEESSERTGDERPYRLGDSLGHFKPIDFQFHVVFLSCVCESW